MVRCFFNESVFRYSYEFKGFEHTKNELETRLDNQAISPKIIAKIAKKSLDEMGILTPIEKDEGYWIELKEQLNELKSLNEDISNFISKNRKYIEHFYVSFYYRDKFNNKSVQKFIKKSIINRIKFYYKLYLKTHQNSVKKPHEILKELSFNTFDIKDFFKKFS